MIDEVCRLGPSGPQSAARAADESRSIRISESVGSQGTQFARDRAILGLLLFFGGVLGGSTPSTCHFLALENP